MNEKNFTIVLHTVFESHITRFCSRSLSTTDLRVLLTVLFNYCTHVRSKIPAVTGFESLNFFPFPVLDSTWNKNSTKINREKSKSWIENVSSFALRGYIDEGISDQFELRQKEQIASIVFRFLLIFFDQTFERLKKTFLFSRRDKRDYKIRTTGLEGARGQQPTAVELKGHRSGACAGMAAGEFWNSLISGTYYRGLSASSVYGLIVGVTE